ncbi:MAG: hypothetical protein GF411_12920 [Candidatus Lokiarchaeota archaeon]|nr:hypothetical protein [Candidatus Lokiarchaeota archaeon]
MDGEGEFECCWSRPKTSQSVGVVSDFTSQNLVSGIDNCEWLMSMGDSVHWLYGYDLRGFIDWAVSRLSPCGLSLRGDSG